MNRIVRKRLDMALRVRDFSRGHPSTDPSFALVLARLEECIARMQALFQQQIGGFLTKHSSTVRRSEIKRRLRAGLLRHLVTIAEDAVGELPALTGMFKLPSGTSSNRVFQTNARRLYELGLEHKEVLMRHGLSERLLAELGAAVDELDASLAETVDGLQGHVLAGAELRHLGDEMLRVVRMMDAINRCRFEHEPHLLVAWESVKHIVAEPQSESNGPGGAPSGEIEPAA